MKLQWSTMTDLAEKVLRKLGAVPLSEYEYITNEYNALNKVYHKLDYAYRAHVNSLEGEIRNLAKSSPLLSMRVPDMKADLTVDDIFQTMRLRIDSLCLNMAIDKHTLNMHADNVTYARMVAEHISRKFAEKSKEVVFEALIKEIK